MVKLEFVNFLTKDRIMKYKFRAEMPIDAELIKKALKNSIVDWKEFDVFLDLPEGPYKVPDIEVIVEIIESGPTLDEIREIMNNITDCHIATQTLNYLDEYTGERNRNF
jgi:hypothetical protein